MTDLRLCPHTLRWVADELERHRQLALDRAEGCAETARDRPRERSTWVESAIRHNGVAGFAADFRKRLRNLATREERRRG